MLLVLEMRGDFFSLLFKSCGYTSSIFLKQCRILHLMENIHININKHPSCPNSTFKELNPAG